MYKEAKFYQVSALHSDIMAESTAGGDTGESGMQLKYHLRTDSRPLLLNTDRHDGL